MHNRNREAACHLSTPAMFRVRVPSVPQSHTVERPVSVAAAAAAQTPAARHRCASAAVRSKGKAPFRVVLPYRMHFKAGGAAAVVTGPGGVSG